MAVAWSWISLLKCLVNERWSCYEYGNNGWTVQSTKCRVKSCLIVRYKIWILTLIQPPLRWLCEKGFLKKIGQLVQFLGSSWYSCTVNNNAPLSIYGIINGKMVIWSKVLKLTVKIFSTSQWKEDMNYPNIKATHLTQDFPSEKCTQAPLLKRFQGWQVDYIKLALSPI